MSAGIFLGLGAFKGLEDLVADSNCIRKALQTWGIFLKLVMTEVAVSCARRQDQVVVGKRHAPAVRGVGKDQFPILIDAYNFCQQHGRIALLA